ncbi:MAG: AmmeMemoRadiSam system radical SAM enzyme [Nanoarchaeota archaeon]
MKKAILFKKLKNKKVQCTACSWYCKIDENKFGICGIRQNLKGNLYLLVYGKAVAVHTDPMEKKPLFHFLPGKKIFSIGTIGCNFACNFCQNWDISQAVRMLKEKSKEELTIGKPTDYGQELSPKKIVDYVRKQNIPAIAFTYNEPAIFFEYAYDTVKLAKKYNIKTVFVSNGYESKEALQKINPYLDALNIDLKSFNEQFYLKTCKARLQPVLENIKRIYNMGFWLEITTLLIPGMNDSKDEVTKMAKFILSISKDIPWHLSAFHPDYKMTEVPETPHETLLKSYKIAKDIGLRYVYLGNVFDPEKESTYCPRCKSLLIKRMGYNIEIVNLKNGKCNICKEKIAGIWK